MDNPDNTLQQQERRPRQRRGQRRPQGEHGRNASGANLGSQQSANPTSTRDERSPRRPQRRPPSLRPEQSTDEAAPSPSTAPASQQPRPSRRSKFKATLTEASEAQTSAPSAPQHQSPPPPVENTKPRPKLRRAREQPPGDDLTSTLTHALRTPPFPDCSICFNPIRPEHSTWSCSPPTSTEARTEDKDTEGSHCCWNTFHLKCIRAWAEKNVRELEEAWRARGESRPGEWRCPGCRATRQVVPRTYMYATVVPRECIRRIDHEILCLIFSIGAFVCECVTPRRRASPRHTRAHNPVPARARRADTPAHCRVIQARVHRVR
ncbi:hypothetical protein J3R82DRAFT_6769 [Butyriboletus roseoflavus]|nr:hypothetical protein J3R82DRAFT_6769 [Butyriboletus roseoflavus]